MYTTLAILFSRCAPLVHPVTLGALVHVESAGHPYAISINHAEALEEAGSRVPVIEQPQTRREALEQSQVLLARGYTLSVGLAQINTEHLPLLRRAGLARSLSDLFDPCINLQAAQAVLIACQTTVSGGQASLVRTLSCYNSGRPTWGLTNGYVQRVVQAARRDALRSTAGPHTLFVAHRRTQ